jgi:Cu+-exporting ATPase
MQTTGRGMALATLAILTVGSAVSAQNPAPTTITIPHMRCMFCANALASRLQVVEGVAKVQTDILATKLIVTPKTQTLPSPRALWEAIEKAGCRPSRLEGPSGTFTEKPRS